MNVVFIQKNQSNYGNHNTVIKPEIRKKVII